MKKKTHNFSHSHELQQQVEKKTARTSLKSNFSSHRARNPLFWEDSFSPRWLFYEVDGRREFDWKAGRHTHFRGNWTKAWQEELNVRTKRYSPCKDLPVVFAN